MSELCTFDSIRDGILENRKQTLLKVIPGKIKAPSKDGPACRGQLLLCGGSTLIDQAS